MLRLPLVAELRMVLQLLRHWAWRSMLQPPLPTCWAWWLMLPLMLLRLMLLLLKPILPTSPRAAAFQAP